MTRRKDAQPTYWAEYKRGQRERMTEDELNAVRLYQRVRRYGITSADFIAQYTNQAGRCATCDLPVDSTGHSAHIDHDHASGEVRGLLCHRCNQALGAIDADRRDGLDPMVRLRRLVEYAANGGIWERSQMTLEEATA